MILPKKLPSGISLQHNQRALLDRFAIKLEVDSSDDLILLQRRMQFTAVQHIAGFQIFHATTRNGQVHVFINP